MASTGECDKRFEQSMTKDTDPSDGVDYHAQSIALPRSNTEYGKKTYWDERFATEPEYEWLASWEDVAYLLKPFLSPSSHILVVGCGNSSFSADLYDAGYTDICSLDYSEIVIDAVKTRNETIRPEMTWMVCVCVILQVKMVITFVYSLQLRFSVRLWT
jgi:SAM-dependent methyltransferase